MKLYVHFLVAFLSQYGPVPPFPTKQWECVSTGDQVTLWNEE